MSWVLAVVAVLSAGAPPVPGVGPISFGPNLLLNADVESAPGEADWEKRTPDDDKRALEWSDETPHGGSGCLKITLLDPERSRWRQGQGRSIGVEPEWDLFLEGYIRTELEASGRAYFTVFCNDENGSILVQTRSRWVRAESEWSYRSLWIPIPHGAAYVMVYCEAQGALGEAWFDDVSLRLVQPPPKPQPPWVEPVLLATDPGFPTPVPVAVNRIAAGAVEEAAIDDPAGLAAIASAPRVCVAPLGRERDLAPVADSVRRALEAGGTVVCHLDLAAELLEARLIDEPLAGLPTLEIPLPQSDDLRQVILKIRNYSRGDSGWYLLGPDGQRLFGEVQKDPDAGDDKEGQLVSFAGLPPGPETVARLGVCPGGRDPCLIKLASVRAGEQTLGSWLPVDLGRDGFTAAKEPSGAVQVEAKAVGRPTVVITAESDTTRGFSEGDRVPWYGGIARCGLTNLGNIRAGALAARDDGAVVALEVKWPGGGRLVACDLLGAEPLHRLAGGMSKYVLLSNALGRGVGYGRFFAQKPKYDEVVAHLQSLAANSAVPVRLVEEGPGCEGRQIVSLTFGDPRDPLLLVHGATHGTEFEPALGLVRLCELLTAGELTGALDLERYCLKVIPVLGPSGYDAGTRCQANGINLNRQSEWNHENYKGGDTNKDGEYGPGDGDWKGPAPFTAPEAKVIKRIIEEHRIHAAIDLHTNSSYASLPVTALPENELRVGRGARLFREMFRGRHVWARGDGHTPGVYYRVWHQAFAETLPSLTHATAENAFGTLLELPGYAGDPYATLIVSDLTVCAVLAHFKAFTEGAPAP